MNTSAIETYFLGLSDKLKESETTKELVCCIIDVLDSDKSRVELLKELKELAPDISEVLGEQKFNLLSATGIKTLLRIYAHIILKEHPTLQFPVWACAYIGELYNGNFTG